MADPSEELLRVVGEVRDLLRLIAEPQIAARDEKLRADLVRIVGRSAPKRQSVLLMDGSRTQAEICAESGIGKGHVSELTTQLRDAKLLVVDSKNPKLAISIPSSFFDAQ